MRRNEPTRITNNPIMWTRIFVILCACLALAGCSSRAELPDDARRALVAHWESLPAETEIEYTIVRAWQGRSREAPDREIWCVDTEIDSPDNPDIHGETLIWILFRFPVENSWSAALLATMSSTWPYEACGQGP